MYKYDVIKNKHTNSSKSIIKERIIQMSVINFTPIKLTNYLNDGEYRGEIQEINYNEDTNNFWFKIKVGNEVFYSMLSGKSVALNDFAFSCLNEEAKFDTDLAINKSVKFSVINKPGIDYSKIRKIEIIK